MAGTDFETLITQRDRDVLHVTLNRPHVRNAMSLAMVRELTAALQQAEADGTRVIVLNGAGGHFCAGADLKDMADACARPVVDGRDPVTEANAAIGYLCAAFAQTPCAVIGILEGAVMGGGFGLACTVDVAIAGSTVDFRLPETSLGIVPAQIAPFLVERIGYSEAKRLSVTGGRFGGVEAYRIGLIHVLCHDADALQNAKAETIESFLSCAPGAVAATKALLRRARFEDAATLVEYSAKIFTDAVRGEEGVEGLAAFAGKRKPRWHN